MVKRASMQFHEVVKPITEAVTKFGGQPVWLENPQWPYCTNGQQMRFICQVALAPEIFGRVEAKMVYLFFADDSANSWPHDFENAVIIQPGIADCGPSLMPGWPDRCENILDIKLDTPNVLIRNSEKGPTLLNKDMCPCEYNVSVSLSEDCDFIDHSDRIKMDLMRNEQYMISLLGNKVGGTPLFWQAINFPSRDRFRLVLQIDSTEVPFHLNLSGTGVGYMFISKDGKRGKFSYYPAVRSSVYNLVANGHRQITINELGIVQEIIRNNKISNGNELERALNQQKVGKCMKDAPPMYKNTNWGKVIDILVDRKQISFARENNNNEATKCCACKVEIRPYWHGLKLCQGCTYNEFVRERIATMTAELHDKLAGIGQCNAIFSGAECHMHTILFQQVAFLFLAHLVPVDKYPLLGERHT